MPERDGRDLSLVFLIDALGKEIVGRDGFLDALVPRNRPRVRSILGYSSAAIPTLFTGVPPAVHGHWAMYRRDRGDSVFRPYARRLRLASKLPAGKWRTRRWLTAQLRRDGLTGYFSLYEVPLGLLPFFDLSERRNIYRPGAFDGVRSLFDRLVEESVPYRVWDWSVPEERSFSEMEAAAREGNERFLMLYSSGLDGVMHVHGPDSPAARAWLKQAEGRIGAVVDAARRACLLYTSP
ncbi:MAG: alkaline phosphatase family protein, partial [Candidatus Eisenbacteria bacterium]|nr:alkaline phosphatase family protein [Candidatus Eisenbacteria bacterium]